MISAIFMQPLPLIPMKSTPLFFPLLVGIVLLLPGCNKQNPEPDRLPDLIFQATLSGAQTFAINENLPEGKATSFIANGAFVSVSDLLSITALDGQDYNLSIVVSNDMVETGTFPLNQSATDRASFNHFVEGYSFTSTGGTLTITKAELYQGVTSVEDWYIDGTFSIDLESSTTQGETATLTGEFRGMNIKAN